MTLFPVDYTCPVGGERFTQNTVGSGTSFGHYLDGRQYGPIASPWPIVECPGNGFLMFQEDFTDAELEVLAAAIASDEYRAMREQGESQYWRLAWLLEALGIPLAARAGVLQRATWEAPPGRYGAYVQVAATALAGNCPDQAAADARDLQWTMCQMIRGEWERRTARFEVARARFERLQDGLVVPLPDAPNVRAWIQLAAELRQQLSLLEAGDTGTVLAVDAAARQAHAAEAVDPAPVDPAADIAAQAAAAAAAAAAAPIDYADQDDQTYLPAAPVRPATPPDRPSQPAERVNQPGPNRPD